MFFIIAAAFVLIMTALGPTKTFLVHDTQLVAIGFAFALLLLPIVSGGKKRWFPVGKRTTFVLWLVVVLEAGLLALYDSPLYLADPHYLQVLALVKWSAWVIIVCYGGELISEYNQQNMKEAVTAMPVLRHGITLMRNKFPILMGFACVMRLMSIWHIPQTPTDVFFFMNEAPPLLVEGINPYASVFSNPFHLAPPGFVNWVYSYLPASILFSLPSVLLFQDVRYGNIAVLLVIAWMIYRWCAEQGEEKKIQGELLALALLFMPFSLFVTEHPGPEPFILLGVVLFAWCELRKKTWWGAVCLGVVLATKQVVAPFFYFALFLEEKINVKKIALAGTVAAVIMLPFFLWSPKDFVNDTILHHARYILPTYAVTLNSWYKIGSGHDIPTPLFMAFVMVIWALVTRFLWRRRGVFAVIYGTTVFIFGIFFFRQAFTNYYYLIGGLLLILLTMAVTGKEEWYAD